MSVISKFNVHTDIFIREKTTAKGSRRGEGCFHHVKILSLAELCIPSDVKSLVFGIRLAVKRARILDFKISINTIFKESSILFVN